MHGVLLCLNLPQGTLKPVALQDLSRISPEELELVPSPATGTPGALTPPREFNLMFQTNVGAMAVRIAKSSSTTSWIDLDTDKWLDAISHAIFTSYDVSNKSLCLGQSSLHTLCYQVDRSNLVFNSKCRRHGGETCKRSLPYT